MGLGNRIDRLESTPGMCPHCGRREPIRLIEVVFPGPPLSDVLTYATPAEAAELDRIASALYRRAGVKVEGLVVRHS